MAKAGKGEAPKTNAMRELDRAGIDFEVHAYDIEDETTVGIGQRVAQVTGIDEHGELAVVDPLSRDRTSRHWTFDEIISQATGLWSYTAAA